MQDEKSGNTNQTNLILATSQTTKEIQKTIEEMLKTPHPMKIIQISPFPIIVEIIENTILKFYKFRTKKFHWSIKLISKKCQLVELMLIAL